MYLKEFCHSPGYSADRSYRHLQSRYVIWENLEFAAPLVPYHPMILSGTDQHLKKRKLLTLYLSHCENCFHTGLTHQICDSAQHRGFCSRENGLVPSDLIAIEDMVESGLMKRTMIKFEKPNKSKQIKTCRAPQVRQ